MTLTIIVVLAFVAIVGFLAAKSSASNKAKKVTEAARVAFEELEVIYGDEVVTQVAVPVLDENLQPTGEVEMVEVVKNVFPAQAKNIIAKFESKARSVAKQ